MIVFFFFLESGFCTDASTAGDSPETEEPRHKRAERSDSLLSSDSLSTNVSPTETPCLKYDQSFEEVMIVSLIKILRSHS